MGIRALFRQLFICLRHRSRNKRFNFFWKTVGQFAGSGLWLDLGGGAGSYFLSRISAMRSTILLDLDPRILMQARAQHPHITCIVADGQHLPFKDQSISCVFCNSVIEHVKDPEALSLEVRRVGQSFFVQTPNGLFPLETHSMIPIPFYHFLPLNVRRSICKLVGASFDYIESVTYLSETQIRKMYPRSTIAYERSFGLVKAYFALTSQSKRS